MKRAIITLFLAGSLCASMQVLAGDPASSSSSDSSQSKMQMHKMMKECMAKQRAANNGMSETDMEQSCKDQIKAKVDNPDDQSQPVVPAH